MAPTKLRVALVWHGELMADHLASTSAPVTLGTAGGATFVVPALPVPDGFAIVRPEGDGWVLALAGGLGGTAHTGGELRQVGGATGAVAGGVQLVPIGGGDWGVIALADGLELFFQFVADDTRLPRSRSHLDLLTPALAFALLLHGVMLFATYVFDENIDPFTYPGSKRVVGDFLVQRVNAPPEPEKALPGTPSRPAAATVPSPGGGQGDSGGSGGEPEAGTPTGDRSLPPSIARPPERGLFTPRNQNVIDRVIGHDMKPSLGRFLGLPGPRRAPGPPGVTDGLPGGGTRPGQHLGPGRGHDGPGRDGPLNIGPIRDRTPGPGTGPPVEAEVKLLPPTTDGDTSLTHKEINDVVQSRAGLIRACYQRGADQVRSLAGTLTVRFTIGADGRVTESKIDKNKSDLQDGGVEACVLRQINRLVFPARGGGRVSYPFRFSQR